MAATRAQDKHYVICGPSALDFWRRFGRDCLVQATPQARCEACELERFLGASSSASVRARPPVTLLASQKSQIRRNARQQWKLFSSEIPAGHVIPVAGSISVTSPELTLVTLGEDLCPEDIGESSGRHARELLAMRTCMRMCGTQHPVSGSNLPLTCAYEIGELLRHVSYTRGAPLLRKVIPFVQDNAPDDYAIWLFQLFCLPRRYGALGLPRATLSQSVRACDEYPTTQGPLDVDLYWPSHNLGLKIAESNHPFTRSVRGGRARIDIRCERDTTVILATASCLLDPHSIFDLGSAIARRMRFDGLRSRMIYPDRMRALVRMCPYRAGCPSADEHVPMSQEDPLVPPGWHDILRTLS